MSQPGAFVGAAYLVAGRQGFDQLSVMRFDQIIKVGVLCIERINKMPWLFDVDIILQVRRIRTALAFEVQDAGDSRKKRRPVLPVS